MYVTLRSVKAYSPTLLSTHNDLLLPLPPSGFPHHQPVLTEPIARSHPLQEANAESGPVRMQVPFSMQDLKQMQQDLGSCSDDPDEHIERF